MRRPPTAAEGPSLLSPLDPAAGRAARLLLLAASLLVVLLAMALVWRFDQGVGVWGLDQRLSWAAEIATLDFWLGLALAVSFVGAMLDRAGAEWSAPAQRLAAPVALAAAGCAALVGLVHLGRPRFAYWLLPIPTWIEQWPNAGSPIAWATVAVAGWLALAFARALRGPAGSGASIDRRLTAATAGAALVALLAVGAASAAVPLGAVQLSLHAVSFAAGAVVAGLAALAALAEFGRAPASAAASEEPPAEFPASLLARAATLFGAALAAELLVGRAIGDAVERTAAASRISGPSSWTLWLAVALAVAAPQLGRAATRDAGGRRRLALALAALAGVGLERLSRLVAPLERGPLPASWTSWTPTFWDAALALGGLGLFVALLAVSVRRLDHRTATGETA